MSRISVRTALPLPTREYNIDYMNRLLRQIELSLDKLNFVGPITCASDLTNQAGYPVSGLTIINIPTSSTGLPVGSVWSDGGTLKIVS